MLGWPVKRIKRGYIFSPCLNATCHEGRQRKMKRRAREFAENEGMDRGRGRAGVGVHRGLRVFDVRSGRGPE